MYNAMYSFLPSFLKYLSVLTTLWKIYLLFGQHTVACVSHNVHKYHSLDMEGFLKFYFFLGYAKQFNPCISCVFHVKHQVHSACKALADLQLVFFTYLKARRL